jgi:hypothetical protein
LLETDTEGEESASTLSGSTEVLANDERDARKRDARKREEEDVERERELKETRKDGWMVNDKR